MRAFLILLAIACPVALATPGFWSVWRMATSAEPVGYVYPDGETQWGLIGPKAHWPGWAMVPQGAQLDVRSSVERTPTRNANGYGEITLTSSAHETQRDYVRRLEASGWRASPSWIDVPLPEIPPRTVRLCLVDAVLGERVLRLAASDARGTGLSRLHWSEGGTPWIPVIGSRREPCPGD